MELSKRLQAVADLVGNNLVVADVGTDHGYIPIYLIESGKCQKAFAMDVNEGPLLRAKNHIQAHGLTECITTRLSDGVKAVSVGECDCVVVAGMGGALAIKIMEEGKEVTEVTEEVQKYIKKGDVLICKKKFSSITIGNSYTVNDFYYFEGRPYGIVITDDDGNSHQICNTLVTELFYLPNNQTDMVNHKQYRPS